MEMNAAKSCRKKKTHTKIEMYTNEIDGYPFSRIEHFSSMVLFYGIFFWSLWNCISSRCFFGWCIFSACWILIDSSCFCLVFCVVLFLSIPLARSGLAHMQDHSVCKWATTKSDCSNLVSQSLLLVFVVARLYLSNKWYSCGYVMVARLLKKKMMSFWNFIISNFTIELFSVSVCFFQSHCG